MQINRLYWLAAVCLAVMALIWQFALSAGQDAMRDDLRPKGPQDQVGIISWGERVELDDWTVDGHRTLFAAVSRMSAESQETMYWLEPLCVRRGVLLRKIALRTGTEDVVKQYDIGHPLPALWLYDGKKLVSNDRDDVLRLLRAKTED